jgi:hypothetical protein
MTRYDIAKLQRKASHQRGVASYLESRFWTFADGNGVRISDHRQMYQNLLFSACASLVEFPLKQTRCLISAEDKKEHRK